MANPPPPTTARTDRPPRPMNAWLLFRNAQVKRLNEENPSARRSQGELSKVISELWRTASLETKREYDDLAKVKKAEHQLQYPDYRYAPMPKGNKSSKPRSVSSSSKGQANNNIPSQVASSSLNVPTAVAGSSGRSPRSSPSTQPSYHPYSPQRPGGSNPLPPIDTFSPTNFPSSSNWHPSSASSAVGQYFSTTQLESVSSRGAPSVRSAPADFSSFAHHQNPSEGEAERPFYPSDYTYWGNGSGESPSETYPPQSAGSSSFSSGPLSASPSTTTQPGYPLPSSSYQYLPAPYSSRPQSFPAPTQPNPTYNPPTYPYLQRPLLDLPPRPEEAESRRSSAHETPTSLSHPPSTSFPDTSSSSSHRHDSHSPYPSQAELELPQHSPQHHQPEWNSTRSNDSANAHFQYRYDPYPPPPQPPSSAH